MSAGLLRPRVAHCIVAVSYTHLDVYKRQPEYRSKTSTAGRNMAGARALWRATGMTDGDFHKPIIAIANSFTQFVPGHVHLKLSLIHI